MNIPCLPILLIVTVLSMIPAGVFGPYAAGAALLAIGLVAIRKEAAKARGLDKVVVLGRLCYAVPLAVFAAEHFTATKFIATAVPSWMPAHVFWVYFVGTALMAAALSITVGPQSRLAATLLGIMFFHFVLLIHLPNVIAKPGDRIAWAVALRDLSFSGGAWAFAGAQTEKWRERGSNWITTIGRFFVGTPAIFFGVEHFLHPDHAPGVPLPKVTPTWIPGRLILAYVAGTVLIIAGGAIVANRMSRLAATLLGIMILVVVLVVYLPITIGIPSDIGNGLNYFADTLMFGGTALMLATGMAPREKPL